MIKKKYNLYDCLGVSYMNYEIKFMWICEKLSINHFSVISINKVSLNSNSFYNRIKGEADEEILKKYKV